MARSPLAALLMTQRHFVVLLLLASLASVGLYATARSAPDDGGQVNVYSYRQPFLVEPLFDAFTAETGIDVKVIFAKKGLIERAKAEGASSPADVILTVDIARLSEAAKTIAQPVASSILENAIPAEARAEDRKWFGLSWRARIAYVSKTRVSEQALRYEDLAHPKWKGRICLRSGQHPYNNALFAAMLSRLGEPAFRDWLTGLKANLSEKPSGNDRAQVRRVYGGTCDVAIGNTYYMGEMQTNEKKPEQKQWAASVTPIFPTMPNGGTHVNVSGMVLAKYAPNKANGIRLMEFLASKPAQKIYAETNFEYPIRTDVPASALVKSWGRLTPDTLAMDQIAAKRKRASAIVDETAFNDGP
jgi:iron(III) transport system substrate-binding protein